MIWNQLSKYKQGGNYPPFLKGGQGGLNNRLIIPLNPPFRKGGLKPRFLTFID
jgi:hypothetical protein